MLVILNSFNYEIKIKVIKVLLKSVARDTDRGTKPRSDPWFGVLEIPMEQKLKSQ